MLNFMVCFYQTEFVKGEDYIQSKVNILSKLIPQTIPVSPYFFANQIWTAIIDKVRTIAEWISPSFYL
jgi:hypothetical protein